MTAAVMLVVPSSGDQNRDPITSGAEVITPPFQTLNQIGPGPAAPVTPRA
jgi:hypothetical protein